MGDTKIEIDLDAIASKNRPIFDHFSKTLIVAHIQEEVKEEAKVEQVINIGALTNFEQVSKKEEVKHSTPEEEETKALTVEELEQRKLEQFRAEKKEELEEMNKQSLTLNEKLSIVKTEAMQIQSRFEENCKSLDIAEGEIKELGKEVKAKDKVLQCSLPQSNLST